MYEHQDEAHTCYAESKFEVFIVMGEVIFLHFTHVAWKHRMVQAKGEMIRTDKI